MQASQRWAFAHRLRSVGRYTLTRCWAMMDSLRPNSDESGASSMSGILLWEKRLRVPSRKSRAPRRNLARTTTTLLRSQGGDPRAFDRLFALVYQDFRALAKSYLARERHAVTLQPTALVNEAYLRLVDQTRVDWKGRTHFFAVGAMAMRRILVNHAIAAKRLRRGGGQIVNSRSIGRPALNGTGRRRSRRRRSPERTRQTE